MRRSVVAVKKVLVIVVVARGIIHQIVMLHDMLKGMSWIS